MRYYLIIILILLLIPSSALGYVRIAQTTDNEKEMLNMTQYANNINNQVIINIPKETLINKSQISSIKFWCGYNYTLGAPTQNLAFRFYIYSGGYILIDNNYITPSQCLDSYAYPITWNLYNLETINHNYDYAIGFYSLNENSGAWQFPIIREANYSEYSPYHFTWVNVSDGLYTTPIINESITDLSHNPVIVDGSPIRHVSTTQIYGSIEIPTPTPTPTPQPTATPGTIPGTDNSNCTMGNQSCNPYKSGDYNNTFNNSLPENTTGFKDLLESNGYTSNVGGAIGFIQDWILFYCMLGMFLYSAKLMRWI